MCLADVHPLLEGYAVLVVTSASSRGSPITFVYVQKSKTFPKITRKQNVTRSRVPDNVLGSGRWSTCGSVTVIHFRCLKQLVRCGSYQLWCSSVVRIYSDGLICSLVSTKQTRMNDQISPWISIVFQGGQRVLNPSSSNLSCWKAQSVMRICLCRISSCLSLELLFKNSDSDIVANAERFGFVKWRGKPFSYCSMAIFKNFSSFFTSSLNWHLVSCC